MSRSLSLVGFGFAQPTLRHIKGFGDLTMQIFSAIQVRIFLTNGEWRMTNDK